MNDDGVKEGGNGRIATTSNEITRMNVGPAFEMLHAISQEKYVTFLIISNDKARQEFQVVCL